MTSPIDMLDTLRSIVQEVNAAQDLQSALSITVRRTRAAMDTEVASAYLIDRVSGRYRLMATEGLAAEAIGVVSLGLGEGLTGTVALRAEPLNLDDATQHPEFVFMPDIGEEKFHAFMGVPIIHHRQVLGVLVVQQVASRRFDENEEAFLVTLCAQLAGVIAHAEATGALDQLTTAGMVRSARFAGVPGSSGIGMGKAVVMFPPANLDVVPDRSTDDVDAELLLFERAINAVREDITALGEKLADSLPKEEQALFDAYLAMLHDTAIAGEVNRLVTEGHWAQGALRTVIMTHVANFERMEDSYLRERAADVKELGQRVLAYLQDVSLQKTDFPERTVMVGEEVTPAMLGEVPPERLVGIVSLKGSSNSHVAILARALGIPTVMGAVDLPINRIEGLELIVDGFQGQVLVGPDPQVVEEYQALIEEEKGFTAELEELRDLPCETPDGHRVRLWVNIGLSTDILLSLDRGAEGIGLYRTEIPFMSKDRFPTEEEQRVMYREHMEAFTPRPVTMRTLDIGGDKELSYFPIKEDNPFLGWRGIRVTLDHPEIFLVQVRAMIKASAGLEAPLRIMLPMVTHVSEVEEALELIHRCYQEVVDEGVDARRPQVGVMIEVPAAVYQAREIARMVDFLNVGTNDLTQYMLAVDRNNPRVANLYRDLHPSVLQALMSIVEQGHREGRPVGICGELAGTPAGMVLLMAMGFDVLSMNSTSLLRAKWVIRNMPMKTAKELLDQVLTMSSSETISAFMAEALRDAGLGRAVRTSGS